MNDSPIKNHTLIGLGLDVVEGAVPRKGESRQIVSGCPSLQVSFRCANLYQRVYRSADGNGYRAMCGKCGKTMDFVVGTGGTTRRVFEVSC